MTEYSSLREANAARELERDPRGLVTPLYKAVELGGELGECLTCLNVVKKIERERLGLPGSRASVADLADVCLVLFVDRFHLLRRACGTYISVL
jgi:hypothetical protein